MLPKISKITQQKENCSTAVIIDNTGQISSPSFSEREKKYTAQKLKDKNECTVFKLPHIFFFHKTKKEDGNSQTSIAGKFLEHFTGYPWLHLDIAGVAYLHKKIAYRPEGGNDFGTRLLCHFLKKFN
ncbi:MAG: hypothetical protein R6U03_08610 [Gillisia sp.]